MPNKDDIGKGEQLAANLARGMGKPYWLINNNGQLRAVKKPLFGDLGFIILKEWLLTIGISFEGEFDTTGRKVF